MTIQTARKTLSAEDHKPANGPEIKAVAKQKNIATKEVIRPLDQAFLRRMTEPSIRPMKAAQTVNRKIRTKFIIAPSFSKVFYSTT